MANSGEAAWETLGCLSNGGTLVMRGSDWSKALKQVSSLLFFIVQQSLIRLQIEVLICTPSILAKYNPSDFPNLKVAATAGEPSSQKYVRPFASRFFV